MAHEILEFNEIHLRRLYQIAKQLSGGREMSVIQIAKRFRISNRTAFREIHALSDIGIKLNSVGGLHSVPMSAAAVKSTIDNHVRKQVDRLMKRVLR